MRTKLTYRVQRLFLLKSVATLHDLFKDIYSKGKTNPSVTFIHNLQSKELSTEVKPSSHSARKQKTTHQRYNRNIWDILRKEECTGELSNIKNPGCPWKTTVLDVYKILSGVNRKKSFRASIQGNNTLREVSILLLAKYSMKKTEDDWKWHVNALSLALAVAVCYFILQNKQEPWEFFQFMNKPKSYHYSREREMYEQY